MNTSEELPIGKPQEPIAAWRKLDETTRADLIESIRQLTRLPAIATVDLASESKRLAHAEAIGKASVANLLVNAIQKKD